jgi:hypothetical protein
VNTCSASHTRKRYLFAAAWIVALAAAALVSLSLGGCAFSLAQAPIDLSTFQGRYLFKSQGVNISVSPNGPFFEAGICIADGKGHYTVISTENASGQLLQDNTAQLQGTYSLDAQGVGTMRTANDTANFYISADGNHAYVVSTENYATWLVELTRE